MNADPAVLSALVIAVGALVTTLVTNRNNKRSQDATHTLESRRVSLDEFEAHKAFMSEQIAELRLELATERQARVEAETRAVAAEKRAAAAEQRVADTEATAKRLERRVSQLEEVLRSNGMPIPPDEP